MKIAAIVLILFIGFIAALKANNDRTSYERISYWKERYYHLLVFTIGVIVTLLSFVIIIAPIP